MTEHDWASVFSKTFAGPVSAVQHRVWTEVLGDDYPASLDTFSYVTNTEIDRAISELTVPVGGLLADLGCGRGGLGLWIAGRLGARLVGVDISDTAVRAGRQRASALGLEAMAKFLVGTFDATGLAARSLDGAVCFDALLFSPDKAGAIEEFSQIFKIGARLVATTWDYHRQPVGRPPQVADHRPLLESAGFVVLTYDETAGWRDIMNHTDELLLESVDDLAEESDADPDVVRADLEEMHATLDCMSRRVFIVAELVG
jgi:SAM-dependent methyltransferase